ncbi:putative ribosomal large subunit pseudouridine synthase SVR1, chloroplastic isoform X1 [Coffea arabica]|uniref:Ribosomal large subunit pseudouridine synthase SVR1, chloroplastic isoform X1 n=1 Tax=Coffea arabica TaxID=13443 RepID=A0A6P6W8Y0_COFAR|nr:putative ribosomal large subunit pseudouridine synthase SVR1, chloroplastic isoform X1 [Coffea arabica]
MAALMAAVAAAASTAFATLHLTKPAIPLTRTTHRHLRTIIASSLSSTPSTTPEFNITFAPPKPKSEPKLKPKPASESATETPGQDSASELDDQLYIPWIVRDESGNLTLQSTPPARLLHQMANAETKKKKKKKEKDSKVKPASPTAEPKFSKAARRFYNENFRDPPQRLSKVLAAAGVASRRNSEELIFGGKVTVNGSVCNTPQTRVDPVRDVIYVNGNRLPKKLPPKVYFALNKPKGYICSAGEKETKSVLSLFNDFMNSWDKRNPGLPKPRLFTVGRLDVATIGLLIVTNDGDFAQKLSHPSSKLSKEYIATIDGSVNKRHLITISEGTVVEGVQCAPDIVELLPPQPDLSRPRIRIVVHEGRNHEVRELVKNAGLEIHALKRIRIGGFRLPSDLGIGKHAELKQANLRALGWKS